MVRGMLIPNLEIFTHLGAKRNRSHLERSGMLREKGKMSASPPAQFYVNERTRKYKPVHKKPETYKAKQLVIFSFPEDQMITFCLCSGARAGFIRKFPKNRSHFCPGQSFDEDYVYLLHSTVSLAPQTIALGNNSVYKTGNSTLPQF
jgi:hypothetical protein